MAWHMQTAQQLPLLRESSSSQQESWVLFSLLPTALGGGKQATPNVCALVLRQCIHDGRWRLRTQRARGVPGGVRHTLNTETEEKGETLPAVG